MSTKALGAVSVALDIITTATTFMAQAERVSRMILAAHADGRDELSDEDWAAIRAMHAEARAALAKALGDTP